MSQGGGGTFDVAVNTTTSICKIYTVKYVKTIFNLWTPSQIWKYTALFNPLAMTWKQKHLSNWPQCFVASHCLRVDHNIGLLNLRHMSLVLGQLYQMLYLIVYSLYQTTYSTVLHCTVL